LWSRWSVCFNRLSIISALRYLPEERVTIGTRAAGPARVVRQTWLAEGVLELRLRPLAGGPLPDWEPGAHLTLELPNGVRRDYSLCGDLDDRREWTIAVLREPASRGGSSFVHDTLRVGQTVEVTALSNNFALRPAPAYRLVAGGIGITPLLAMARGLAATGADWRLFYCGRTRAGMAYLPELSALAGERLTVHCDDEAGGPPDLDVVLAGSAGAHVYCCGPEPLIAAVGERVDPERMHLERFRAAAVEDPDTEEATFEVVCGESGRGVEVPAGVSIVDALAAAGVVVPTSCREGICGTCETKVLAGEPDHRDQLLSAEEHELGQTMLLCVSRSRSPRLVLDLT
jgi:ferredoxin-NADP reductase